MTLQEILRALYAGTISLEDAQKASTLGVSPMVTGTGTSQTSVTDILNVASGLTPLAVQPSSLTRSPDLPPIEASPSGEPSTIPTGPGEEQARSAPEEYLQARALASGKGTVGTGLAP